MRDLLGSQLMQCPECHEWVLTMPGEGVPDQSYRVCDECEAEFMVDIETVELR